MNSDTRPPNSHFGVDHFHLLSFGRIYFGSLDILSHHTLGRPNMPLNVSALLSFHLLDSMVPIDPMECTNQHLGRLAQTLSPIQCPLLASLFVGRFEVQVSLHGSKK